MNMENEDSLAFVEQFLLDRSAFISYCQSLGVKTDERELILYEKEKLLFPAVRVFYPVDGFIKNLNGAYEPVSTEKAAYFNYGSITRKGFEPWLSEFSYYLPRNSTQHSIDLSNQSLPYQKRAEDLPKASLAYYMPQQVLLVEELNNTFTFSFKAVSQDELNKTVEDWSRQQIQSIPNKRDNFNLFERIVHSIIKLTNLGYFIYADQAQHVVRTLFNSFLHDEDLPYDEEDFGAYKEAHIFWEENKKTKLLNQQLSKLNTSAAEIIACMDWLKTFALKKDPIPLLRVVLNQNEFRRRILERKKPVEQGSALFASECYRWIEGLALAVQETQHFQNPSLKTRIHELTHFEFCIICGKIIEQNEGPGRKKSKTCGNESCKKEARNIYIKLKRSSGQYPKKKPEKTN